MENPFIENFNNEFVLDVSSFPYLKTILADMDEQKSLSVNMDKQEVPSDKKLTVYIPDTFSKLLEKAKENPQYYEYFFNLIRKWTKKEIDVNLFQNLLTKQKYGNVTVKFITTDDVKNTNFYNYSMETFKDNDLMPKFSPPFNLLGDVIGKILGMTESIGAYILMEGSYLTNQLKNKISLYLSPVHEFQQQKVEFFNRHIPGLLLLSGLRWSIGKMLELYALTADHKEFEIIPFALGVFDP